MPWFPTFYVKMKPKKSSTGKYSSRDLIFYLLFPGTLMVRWGAVVHYAMIRLVFLRLPSGRHSHQPIFARAFLFWSCGKWFKFQTALVCDIVINETSQIQFKFLEQLPPKKQRKDIKSQEKFAKFFLPVQLKVPTQSLDKKVSFAPKLPPTTNTFSINSAVYFGVSLSHRHRHFKSERKRLNTQFK